MKKVFFIPILLSFFNCNHFVTPEDPREELGLIDATTMRSTASKAIGIANKILKNQKQNFKLRASWENFEGNEQLVESAGKTITVFLLRPKSYFPTFEKELEVISDFRSELENVKVNKEFENCADEDDCVRNLYANHEIGSIVANVMKQQASLEIAKTNPKSNYIALLDSDLQKFKMLFGKNIFGDFIMPGFENFIAIILLHEIGHLNQSFHLNELNGLPNDNYNALRNYHNSLNQNKQEETRADAYAAYMISNYAKSSDKTLSYEDRSVILYIPLQAILVYIYQLFDKSEAGLCRQYFDPTRTHPNLQLRYIAMSLILSEKPKDFGRLESYLNTRYTISNKDFALSNMECSRLHF